MRTLTLQQGSPEWQAHRRTTRNASDAPALMGASPYVTRAELVRRYATGIEPEIDAATQARFDRGHEVEPALRALAESVLGQELYPVTAVSDDGYLGASFDGVTLAEDIIFEAKQTNAAKAECVRRGEIPPADRWQVAQQFEVCEAAETCLYMVGDGTRDGSDWMFINRADVQADIAKLRPAWAQFDADVAAYVPDSPAAPAPAGRAPDSLPALRVEVTGMVTASNLAEFKAGALAVLSGINRDLQTDDDFADAEQTVKWCKGVEDRLQATKAHVLSQTADIEAVFRTMDEVAEETRRIRLELDRLVRAEKEARKAEIVQAGAKAVRAHFEAMNVTLGEHRIQPPQSLTMDLGAAIKGKKSLASMREAVDAAVANAKIAGSQQADRVRANVAILAEHQQHASLFADRVALCATKAPEDLRNLVAARIADHQQREATRLEAERERIRQEEAARIEREQRESIAAAQADTRDVTPVAAASAPAQQSTAQSSPAATERPGARLKLGDLNAWIAPLSITADGLAALGFKPISTHGAAKLYAANDLPRMCEAMIATIRNAPQRAAAKDAA